MISVSVCMITKNEQAHLGACIDSLRQYPVHIIVCDTGSTDDTLSLAKGCADKVITVKWANDFSEARNASVMAAPTDYIFVLDADERLEDIDFSVITDFFINHPQDKAAVHIKSLLSDGGWATSQVPRLFNRQAFKFSGRVHEYLVPVDTNIPVNCVLLPIEVLHFGYALDERQKAAKMERNRTLLQKELENNPNDALLTYHLGATYYEERRYAECANILSGVIDRRKELGLLYKTAVIIYGFSLLHIEQIENALALETRAAEFDDFADFSYFLGQAYLTIDKPLTALKHFLTATLQKECKTLGTNSFLSYYHIGWIYEHMGKKDKAIQFYSMAEGQYQQAKDALQNLKCQL